MIPYPLSCPPRRAASGFTLVEIMVGMIIGMLGLIIMMQVFGLSEEQKRTTTGGGDAQSSGAIALFGLQRDVRQAGYGVSDPKLLGCNVVFPAVPTRATVTLNAIAPLTINHFGIPAGDANTDTLLLVYSSTNGSPQGDGITAQLAATPDIYAVQTPTSFTINDKVIATKYERSPIPPWPCVLTLTAITGVAVGSASNVSLTAGTGVANMVNGTLFNLGQTPKVLAYAIRGGNLTLCDYMVSDCGNANNVRPTATAAAEATVWVPIANNIVSLKAQYGRDTMLGQTPLVTTMDGTVDWYDQATPLGPSSRPQSALAAQGVAQPAPPMGAAPGPVYQCAFARISAVRLALVARNANFEKTAVTTAAPTWEGSTAHTPPNPPTAADNVGWTANPIDLSGNAAWQNFRYRVIQTVVPIRNLAWQGVPLGC